MRILGELKMLPLDSLVPLVGNPNSMTPDQMDKLKASLRAHGLLENIVTQAGTNVVVGGNHRVLAMREMAADGEIDPGTLLPCGEFEFTSDQLRKAAIALNKVTGDIGAAALRDFLDGVPFVDEADLASAGLDERELEFLLSTPWEDDDLLSRSFVVKGKRTRTTVTTPAGGGTEEPPPGDPEALLPGTVVCPNCGHEWRS